MNALNDNVKVLGKNASLNLVGYFVSFITLLILTPYVISILGIEKFGIWAAMSILTSLGSISNLGFDQAAIKFISEFNVKNNKIEIASIVTSSFALYLLTFGIFCTTIFLLSDEIVLYLFNISPKYLNDARFLVRLIAISFFLKSSFSIFRSVILGKSRFDLDNINIVTTRILSLVTIMYLLRVGMGLKGLAISNLIVTIYSTSLYVFLTKRNLGIIPIKFRLFSIQKLKKLFGFGKNVFTSSFFNLAQEPIIKTLLAHMSGVSSITYFDVGNRIPAITRNIFGSSMETILPLASELNSKKDHIGNMEILIMVFRTVFIVAFPIFMVIGIISYDFIKIWINKDSTQISIVMLILLGGHFLGLLSIPILKLMLGAGKSKYSLYESIISIAVFILFAVPLGILLNFYGVALSYSLGYLASFIFLFKILNKEINITTAKVVKRIKLVKLLRLQIPYGITFFLIFRLLEVNNYLGILSFLISFMVIYFIILIRFNYLNEIEKSVIKKIKLKVKFYINKMVKVYAR